MAANQPDADTSYMAEDYWTRQFQEANERAALLDEATVAELVEVYLASDTDFDLGSMCLEALQRRPKRDVRRAGWRGLRTRDLQRRRFAVELVSMGGDGARHRRWLLPLFVRLLRDSEPAVVEAALSAIEAATLRANSSELGARIRAQGDALHSAAWEHDPLPDVVAAEELAPLIHHRDSGVRDHLSESFRFCGTPDATAILLGLTWDTNLYVRAHAALALGRQYVGGRIEEPVRRLWELVDERWLYVRACAITALVELGQQAAEPLVEQALREALESDASRMCIWPLIQLMSRQPNLVGAETRDLFRKRQSSFGEP